MGTIKVGQWGVLRNGQRGCVTAVYANGVLVQADTGATYTVLSSEFTPDAATEAEKALIRKVQERTFRHLTGIGFVYKCVVDTQGNLVESLMRLAKRKVRQPT